MVLKKNRLYITDCLYICNLYGAENKLITTLAVRGINHVIASRIAIENAQFNKKVDESFNPMVNYTLLKPNKFGGALFKLRLVDTTYQC